MQSTSRFGFLGKRSAELLRLVADVIDMAHHEGQASWGATDLGDGIRINVGWTEVFTVGPELVRVIVHLPASKTLRLGRTVEVRRGRFGRAVYPTIRDSACIRIPTNPRSTCLATLRRLWPYLRQAIEISAANGMGRGVKAGHSVTLVDDISSVVGRRLPQPFYAKDAARGASVRPLHVLQANPQTYEGMIRKMAARRGVRKWTAPKSAKRGDLAVFYLTAPRSAFFAIGSILRDAQRNNDRNSDWPGRYFAEVGSVQLLRPALGLAVARQLFPEWRYLRTAQGTVTVPNDLVTAFLRALHSAVASAAHGDAAIEGREREATVLLRSRSAPLRDSALNLSRGVCAACETDFSRVLEGLGLSVLQVHHRKQLARRSAPAPTRVEELAVLCANCHALVHADPKRVMPVETLRARLARG